MRMVFPIAFAVAAMACQRAAGPEVHPHRKLGDYGFRISLAGRNPLDGAFTIAADSVMLETAGQPCRRDFNRIAYCSADDEPVHPEHSCPGELPINDRFAPRPTRTAIYDEPPF